MIVIDTEREVAALAQCAFSTLFTEHLFVSFNGEAV